MKNVIKYGLLGIGGFVVLIISFIVVAGVLVGMSSSTKEADTGGDTRSDVAGVQETKNETMTTTENAPTSTEVKATTSESVPAEYKSALNQAKSYSSTLHLSKKGIYDQLTSEYGGKFTAPAAQYAIDNVDADWNANALTSAKSYQETLSLSPAAIRDQLVSPYGGQFTPEEADYAIANLDK